MIFTYWQGNVSDIAPMVAGWRGAFPTFEVFGDDAVCDILARRGASFPGMYRRITIPACKSDVARLVLLHEYGGMYVDAHSGVGQVAAICDALENLARYELIIFDRRDLVKLPGRTQIINGLLAARRGSEVLDLILQKALDNLVAQESKERSVDAYVPYNIFVLTGPWNLSSTIMNLGLPQHEMLQDFVGRVLKVDLTDKPAFPVWFYRYYEYRKPACHWSERQAVERLFATTS